MTSWRNRERGMGAVAVIVVLVVLAVLAAAIVRLGQASHAVLTQDLLGERASLTAKAGIEWGLYQAFKGSWTTCSGASQTLDLRASSGYRVTVSCDSSTFNEGESVPGTPRVVRLYTIDAVACSGTGACPDNAASVQATYVERRRQVQASN